MIVVKLTDDEGLAALVALASLIPYYLVLWAMKNRIQQQIAFNIEK